MKPINKLYVSDLDGTLLDWRGQLSDGTRAGLIELLEGGCPFTLASARSVASMKPLFEGVPIALPVVELNGAFVSDMATGEHYACQSIASDVVREVCQKGLATNLPPYLSTFDGARDHLYYTEPINDGQLWYLSDRKESEDPRLERVDDVAIGFDHQVVCVTFISPANNLVPLGDWIEEAFPGEVYTHLYENAYDPGWFWLTVHAFHATKASGLAILAERLGVPLRDVTVFGDNINDISMFREAGYGVAVKNAEPDLKRHADEIVGTNEEDAVVAWLRGEWK